MVQWLVLHTSTARGTGSIPGRGTKILQAAWCVPKKKKTIIKVKILNIRLKFPFISSPNHFLILLIGNHYYQFSVFVSRPSFKVERKYIALFHVCKYNINSTMLFF